MGVWEVGWKLKCKFFKRDGRVAELLWTFFFVWTPLILQAEAMYSAIKSNTPGWLVQALVLGFDMIV